MKCEKCGMIMVEENPNLVNASLPPSVWMVCKCGHRALQTIGTYEPTKSFEERFEEANKQDKKIFWLKGDYKAVGGFYFRAFDLVKFIEKLENTTGEVVGIVIETDSDNKDKLSANIELIVKAKEVKA